MIGETESMTQYRNQKELVEGFLGGAVEGFSGSSLALSNLKIKGSQIIHFSTPILERAGERYILNMTRYSKQTDMLQKTIAAALPADSYDIVQGVEMDYRGSLSDKR